MVDVGGDQRDVLVRPRAQVAQVGLATTDVEVRIEAAGIGPAGSPGPAGPAGPPGTPGAAAVWVQVTQAQYDALSPPQSGVLYIVIG